MSVFSLFNLLIFYVLIFHYFNRLNMQFTDVIYIFLLSLSNCSFNITNHFYKVNYFFELFFRNAALSCLIILSNINKYSLFNHFIFLYLLFNTVYYMQFFSFFHKTICCLLFVTTSFILFTLNLYQILYALCPKLVVYLIF